MKKLTLIASAISISLGLSACSDQKTPEQSIAAAQQLISQKDFNTALIELKNAVIEQPNNAEIRALLGDVYIKQGHYLAAEKELERAVRLGATTNVVDKLSFTKLKLGKYDEVFTLLEGGSGTSDEEYMLLLVYAGVASIQTGEIEQGQDYFNQAISLNEQAIYGQMAKAYLAQTKRNYQEALAIIEEVLASSPDNEEALLLKGNLQYSLQDYVHAAETFDEYVKSKPRAFYVKYFQVQSLMKANMVDEAEKIINVILQTLKDAPLANQYKAQVEYSKGNYEQAKLFAEKALQQSNLNVAKMVAGVSAYHLGSYEQSYNYLRGVERLLSNDNPVKRILSIVKLELGYTEQALSSIMQLNNVNTPFLAESSRYMLDFGDVPSALTVIEKAEKLEPENPQIKLLKGSLMLKEGDVAGIGILEKTIQENEELANLDTSLALQYIEFGELKKARAIADKKILTKSSAASGYLILGLYHTKLSEHEAAQSNFDKALSLEPENTVAMYSVAAYAYNQKQWGQAKELLLKVIDKSPNHRQALAYYLNLEINQNNTKAAISYFENLVQSHADSENAKLSLAAAYKANNQLDNAIDVLKRLTGSNAHVSADSYILLGDTYLEAEQLEQALSVYKNGLERFEQHYLLTLKVAGLQEFNKDFTSAGAIIDTAIKQYPNDLPLKILKANNAFQQQNYVETEQIVDDLLSRGVKFHRLSALKGHLAMIAKDFSSAVELYNDAYSLKPNGDNALYLARALNGADKQQEAAGVLENYLSNNQDNYIEILLADLYAKFDREKAIASYKLLVSKLPSNFVLLNNLAWQLYLAERFREALQYSEQAKALNPDNESVLDTHRKISQKI